MPTVIATVFAFGGLCFGLALLWWGGNKTVSYAEQAAYLFGISTFFLGFFLVSITTGIPELTIALSSLWHGVPGVSVGDIIGSNFTDVSLALGLAAMCVGDIVVPKAEKKNILLTLGMTGLLMILVFTAGRLSRWDGGALIIFYLLAMAYFWHTRHAEEILEDQLAKMQREVEQAVYLVTKTGTLIKLLVSIGVVLVGSQVSVQSILALAKQFNFSLEVLGATILAIGTSLPELTISISSVRRREYSLAIGNAIGSVLEQGGLILGLLALASPTPLNIVPVRHVIPFMLFSYLIVFHAIYRREKLNRFEGVLLTFLYVSFLIYELVKLVQAGKTI